jgi:hypothetical protein
MQKNFVSEIDYFLAALGKKYPTPSDSQLKLKKKYDRITKLRDDPEAGKKSAVKIWEEF